MPQRPRPHRVTVKLDRDEYAALEARAVARRSTKSAVVRHALRTAIAADTEPSAALTRDDALALLWDAADGGSVLAQVALARELRLQPPEADAPAAEQPPDELARLRELHARLEEARR
jgi:Ribbon-helix-helix protein, copG family